MDIEEKLRSGAIFIKYILGTNVQTFRQDDQKAAQYLDPLLFSPIQLFNAAERLHEFIGQMNEKTIYIVTDRLLLVWVFVCTQGWITLAGPCRTRESAQTLAYPRMRQIGLNDSDRRDLELYCGTFAQIKENSLADAAHALVKVVYGDMEDAPIIRAALESGSENPALPADEPQRQPFASVEMTYDLESRLIEAVSQGNTAEAMLLIRQLTLRTVRLTHNQTSQQEIKVTVAGIAIARTLLRVAARNAGVPPPAVDALSGEFARRALQAGSADEVNSLSPEMVERFCDLVRQYRLRPYSPLVRKVIHHVLLNLSQELTVEGIARVVSVSPNYLSAVFRKEVGKTLQAYIQHMRLDKSANLLAYTTMPVQEICAGIGIPDNNYFTKVFKKAYGMTPTAYRARPENLRL